MIESWMTKEIKPHFDRRFAQEYTILVMTELVCKVMKDKNTSRDELSKKMDITEEHLNKMLDGEDTLTIRTFSDMLFHLGYVPEMEVIPRK